MLDVHLFARRVGVLGARGRGITFRYTPEALEDDSVPALSVSLPKQEERYPDSRAGPFFRNLLPEQAFRRLVAAAAGAAEGDSRGLLGVIGGECPGAVALWPEGSSVPATPEYRDLAEADVAALFEPRERAAFASAVVRGRLSLPGVQEKIALLRRPEGGWALPLNGAITSHILKQASASFPGLLENEFLCLSLARATGLEVAPMELAGPGGRVLCVERFDRVFPGDSAGGVRRKLHQEDFCQALATDPERKYEFDGGPGLRGCAEVIRRHSALPAEDLARLVRWVGFNHVIGNEDAHAKNLALLYGDSGLRLSPHYDLVSTEIYPGLERRMAMKIGGAADARNVQRRDWERFARALELPWPRVRIWLLDLLSGVREALPDALHESATACGESEVSAGVVEVVARRGERLERELVDRRGQG